jgi:hypothetical protein
VSLPCANAARSTDNPPSTAPPAAIDVVCRKLRRVIGFNAIWSPWEVLEELEVFIFN